MDECKLSVLCMTLGMVETNCYLVWNKESKEALLIDPADSAPQIEKVIRERELTLKALLLTHGHVDHVLAADAERTPLKSGPPVHGRREGRDTRHRDAGYFHTGTYARLLLLLFPGGASSLLWRHALSGFLRPGGFAGRRPAELKEITGQALCAPGGYAGAPGTYGRDQHRRRAEE